MLVGIPEKRILEAVNKLIGADLGSVARGAAPAPQVDIVSGATVTVLVIGDSIVRSATKLIRSGRLGGQGSQAAAAAPRVAKAIDTARAKFAIGRALVGDGSVRRLTLSVADVNQAFEKSGNAAAAARPEEGAPDDTFIDLYVADVAVPTIGRSLLGDDGYDRLAGRLKPGQQALVVAGSGRYSFKGAAYVRGGIFDRIELIQETNSIRFRDRDHTRLGNLAAEGAPDFPEIALFVVPPDFAFDPTEPWVLQLLVQRVVGSRDKAWVTFDLGYTLPEMYLKHEAPVRPAAVAAPPAAKSAPVATPEAGMPTTDEDPLWMRIWRADTAITADAQKNIDFYTGVLGLRLVKLTVNFDDPGSYHLYYGDDLGRPGTIMTFFAWPGARRGKIGPPQVTTTSFAVPRALWISGPSGSKSIAWKPCRA